VAIDGRCGSGKTRLAAQLAAVFPATVLHLDDFYLPPAARRPDWETVPGANMDLNRFLAEALLPARAGETVRYRAYDCGRGAYAAPAELPPRRLILAEGSYAHHPALAAAYDLRVFLTCAPGEQKRRLRAREGERFPVFEKRWIPLEEAYFRQYAIPEKADLVLDTTTAEEEKP